MSELPETFVPGFHDENSVRKMKYNPLGRTGLMVSHLSLGAAGFSPVYGTYSEEECIKTLHQALRSGINYIDTAPWYGQGESEVILGKALKEIPRKAYYIATKVGRYEKEPKNMFDFSSEKTKWSIDNSLKLLGLDYVDIIQAHDIEFPVNLDQVLNECLPTMQEIIRDGKARFIGVNGYPISVLKDCIEKSNICISTVLSYGRMTLLDYSLEEFVPYFKSRELGIICAAAHGMGLLTNNGPQPWHPAPPEIKDICKQAAEYCKSRNVELGRLAMHYAFTRQGPATQLIGMNNRTLLNDNFDVLYNGLSKLEQSVLAEIKEKFFSKLIVRHWEGDEVNKYRSALGLN